MGDKSAIEWTDATWNPIVGCSLVSPGCTNCYAMKWAHTGMKPVKHYAGTTYEDNGAWTGKINAAPEHIWLAPFGWKKPRRIFVNSMGDVFHEQVPDEWIDRLFAIMALCHDHTFQILTKRSGRMRNYMARSLTPEGRCAILDAVDAVWRSHRPNFEGEHSPFTQPGGCQGDRPLRNVWLGVSCEDQRRADERIPDLLATPAAVRFVSAEPLLGPIDFSPYLYIVTHQDDAILACPQGHEEPLPFHDPATTPFEDIASPRLDWIIAGGESGRDARPMHPDWVRSIRDQCTVAGVAFFFKQWGEWAPSTPEAAEGNPRSGWRCLAGHPHVAKAAELYPENGAAFIEHMGKKRAGRLLDGIEHNGYPDLSGEARRA